MNILKKFSLALSVLLLLGSLAFTGSVMAQTASLARVGQIVNINGTVYFVESAGLLGFPDLATFNSWGYKLSGIVAPNSFESGLALVGIVPLKNSNCNSIPEQLNGTCGGTAATVREGALINNNGTIYLVSKTGLYGFTDANTFFSWGFSFGSIVNANSAESSLVMLGVVPSKQAGCNNPLDQINGNCGGTTAISSGSLINENGTIYLVGNGSLYGFPSLAVFNSWGFNFSQVVAANASVQNFSMLGLVPSRDPACNNPLDQIAGKCGTVATTLAIAGVSPASGPVGTSVTITGTGFTSTGNTVNFNGATSSVIPNLTSNGNSLTFTVPTQWTPACSFVQPLCPYAQILTVSGTYQVSVTNANGTSNTINFMVTPAPAPNPSFNIISPAGGEQWTIGSVHTISWTAPTNITNVNISLRMTGGCTSAQTGSNTATITCNGQLPAPIVIAQNLANTGSYNWNIGPNFYAGNFVIVVTDANSSTNAASNAFNLLNPAPAQPTITSINPASGPIGTTITISGSGFAATGNTVKLVSAQYGSVLTISNLASGDGTSLVITMPSHSDPPVCPANAMCSPPPAPLGNYNVTVTNANGTSNSAMFTLTAAGN